MDALLIEGGRALEGRVKVSGSKNGSLPIIAASLLTDKVCQIENAPQLADIATILAIIERLGARIEPIGEDGYRIDASALKDESPPYDLVRRMRASFLTLGPMLARFGRAQAPLPGGCAIGARPVDQHLKGFEALGARIEIENGLVSARVKTRLKGARIALDIPTVTGAMNIMMAASLADGISQIENAPREPEVTELAETLNQMGARVKGAGSSTLTIEGVGSLGGYKKRVAPDRIEAATLLSAAASSGGDCVIEESPTKELAAVIEKLKEAGAKILEEGASIHIRGIERPNRVDIVTAPYPGFPTDAQAQLMALMTIADGDSIIKETIFENRFIHVAELRRLGAKISLSRDTAIVHGIAKLKGAPVMASDLRASASLVLAGLIARGKTYLRRIYHLDRGYERLESKLNALGARIERIKES